MDHGRLEVEIYQIADDAMLKQNRTDGTGWEWGWADWQRDWMNATPHRFAYRCLPLTIVNQTGWWIRNPVGFTATWRGSNAPGSVDFRFDAASGHLGELDQQPVRRGDHHLEHPFPLSHQAGGLSPPDLRPGQLFQAERPSADRNDRERLGQHVVHDELEDHGAQRASPVRARRTLFQAIPLVTNVCADLETADVSYQKLTDNPDLYRAYREWDQGRRRFHDQKASGEVNPTDWQKDYFQGRDAVGRESGTYHMTKDQAPASARGDGNDQRPTAARGPGTGRDRGRTGPATVRRPSPRRIGGSASGMDLFSVERGHGDDGAARRSCRPG